MHIELVNLTKSYESFTVLSSITTSFKSNKTVAILGPSGCGKTTLLNIISNLDSPDMGEVNIYKSRGSTPIGYMMQGSLLLPWRTLEENALLGTEILNSEKDAVLKSFKYYIDAFDLSGCENIMPENSSGGMRQRIALIRTILLKPDILLMDEPFSNLDYDIKLKIQRHLLDFQLKNSTTIILVTHDIEDAIALSDRIIVFSEKPATIKADIPIELGLKRRDPVEARKSVKFREYFMQIWNELKYLDNHE